MDELIADCALLPESMQHPVQPPPQPRDAPPWQVEEACLSRVADLDDYGC